MKMLHICEHQQYHKFLGVFRVQRDLDDVCFIDLLVDRKSEIKIEETS